MDDYVGIPFKNVSNEQGTNRNYIDRPSDELLSRSVDGDVARTSAQRQKDKSSADDYTESSLNEKPTDSSIYYDGDKNGVNTNKHKSNNTKHNM